MISQRILIVALTTSLGALAAPAWVHAQNLPTPSELVSGLDLECYRTPGPPANRPIELGQLNQVLIDAGVPKQTVIVRELEETCVPVRKNTTAPPAAALPFVRQIDLACYRIEAPPLPAPLPLLLTHLNPVLTWLPKHGVKLIRGAQLCLPVAKNTQPPEGPVTTLARFVDLECFDTEPDMDQAFSVDLRQLNPQLTMIPPHTMTVGSRPRRMCVPVRKGLQGVPQPIPQPILDLVRWIDLEKFPAVPPVSIPMTPVTLLHLNPMFQGAAPIPVILDTATSLMVPVMKNDSAPPTQ